MSSDGSESPPLPWWAALLAVLPSLLAVRNGLRVDDRFHRAHLNPSGAPFLPSPSYAPWRAATRGPRAW